MPFFLRSSCYFAWTLALSSEYSEVAMRIFTGLMLPPAVEKTEPQPDKVNAPKLNVLICIARGESTKS